ncbi:50S ribosomal protein L23 [candidate division TM6 bacterium RIFCSPHIGHO2_12_FULL_32_22]|nr:MAG: 50S ribosomal protein L23 [candidate division TM6 bacterium RIFCSPHIGHO2_12_FULL_32_22]
MELSIYQIIKGPVVTDKAQKLNSGLHQLVLNVHPEANKPRIKEAIEKLFNVKVDSVRVLNRKAKRYANAKAKNKKSFGILQKRAIIKLKPGYEVSIFEQQEPTKK